MKTLVYHEIYEKVNAAIHCETRLKKFKREWKLNLIEQRNPNWQDLTESL